VVLKSAVAGRTPRTVDLTSLLQQKLVQAQTPHRNDPEEGPMNRSLRTQAIDFATHMRRRWYLYLPVFAIWTFAYTRLFIDPTPRVPVLFNWTGSLPYRVAWLQHGEHPLQRGRIRHLLVLRARREPRTPDWTVSRSSRSCAALPGDVVTVSGRTVSVNGVVVGTAKAQAFDRRPLEPIAPTVIPPGHYYVQGHRPGLV
jgi:conjugal transfer pilin signal peptidase TrbI